MYVRRHLEVDLGEEPKFTLYTLWLNYEFSVLTSQECNA